MLATAVLAAMLIASHQFTSDHPFGFAANYVYWICRVVAEAGIFIAVLLAAERYLSKVLPFWALLALSIVISLVPFTLAVTAFDLVMGLPELGFNGDTNTELSTAEAFAFELIYLSDNHAVLCVLLVLPRLLSIGETNSAPETDTSKVEVSETSKATGIQQAATAFFDSLDPPVTGTLCSVEAQEHYVQIITTEESRMILYRFSDVVKQLPDELGMQIHRSHWVSYAAVEKPDIQGQSMKLILNDGRTVPVSRTFRAAVERKFLQ